MTKLSFKKLASRDLVATRPTFRIPVSILGIADSDLVDQYLEVVSQHDEAYREAQSRFWTDMNAVIVMGLKDKEREKQMELLRCRQMAALVVGWSFEEECTLDNVAEFLYQNMNMFEAVNTTCAKDQLFFAVRENFSENE